MNEGTPADPPVRCDSCGAFLIARCDCAALATKPAAADPLREAILAICNRPIPAGVSTLGGCTRKLQDIAALATKPAAPIASFLPDHEERAVASLTEAMAAKLYAKYLEGFDGFETASAEHLSTLLRKHVEKGDPVDVANFCAFLHANGQRIATKPAERPALDRRGEFEREMRHWYPSMSFVLTDVRGWVYEDREANVAWAAWRLAADTQRSSNATRSDDPYQDRVNEQAERIRGEWDRRAGAAADFDSWQQNPYTKALQKSIAEDYVPREGRRTPEMDAVMATIHGSPEPAKPVWEELADIGASAPPEAWAAVRAEESVDDLHARLVDALAEIVRLRLRLGDDPHAGVQHPALDQEGWIPVTERLPRPGDTFVVHTKPNGDVTHWKSAGDSATQPVPSGEREKRSNEAPRRGT